MSTSALPLRGYDPEAMAWASVPTTDDANSTVFPEIRSQALLQAAARHSQDKAEMATPGDTMAPGSSVGNVNAPATRATGSKGKAFTKWKPRPMPKPDPEDYVIVIKPRERVSLHEVLTETGYGTAISAYLGPERARAISVLPSRDQNIVIVHTPDIEAADRLIGDFAVNTEKDSIPLQGYLRQDGGNTCHGVIVVRNTDTTETLQHRVCGAPVPLWKSENSAHPTRHASPSRVRRSPVTCIMTTWSSLCKTITKISRPAASVGPSGIARMHVQTCSRTRVDSADSKLR